VSYLEAQPSVYLITASGSYETGQVDALCQSLAEYSVTILDLCQAEIYKTLTLALLVEIPDHQEVSRVFKDILYTAHGQGLTIQYRAVDRSRYQAWMDSQQGRRVIITVLGRTFSAGHIAAITDFLRRSGLDIERVNRLSNRQPLHAGRSEDHLTCFEFAVRGESADLHSMRAACLDISRDFDIDIGVQEDTAYRRYRRLIAFDMDSTLVQTEIIDELADLAGVRKEVEAITAAAMRGELDFRESLERRVGLLRGLDCRELDRLAESLPLTEGAERLIANLKVLGYKIAVLSGGFSYFGSRLQERLGIDYLYANDLDAQDGKLTGSIRGDIVDGPRKAELLRFIAEKEQISLEQTVAVGDGANDLPMLNLAGLGIAFHAKPLVRQGAKQAISNVGLDAVLYFLGLTDREALL